MWICPVLGVTSAGDGGTVSRLHSSRVKMAATPKAAPAKVAVRVKAKAVQHHPLTRSRRGGKPSASKAVIKPTTTPKAAPSIKAQPKAKAAAPTAAEAKAKTASGSVTSETVPSATVQPTAEARRQLRPRPRRRPSRRRARTRMDFVQNAVRIAKTTHPRATLMSSEQLARVSELLPQSDPTAIGNLPEGFMGFEAAIVPIVEALEGDREEAAAGPSRRRLSVEGWFSAFVEDALATHLKHVGKVAHGTGPPFKLADDAGVHFFTKEGKQHGTRTHNHQCDTPGCSDQGCCPTECNFSSMVTCAAQVAKGSRSHSHALTDETFNEFAKVGTSRQQTNGRFTLPAPPILLPEAEVVAAEGCATVEQDRADFNRAETLAGRSKAARWACSDAQHLAIFTTDLSTGKRTADVTAAFTADVCKTGAAPVRRTSVCHKTSKVLLLVHPWCVQERPGSILCPIRAVEHCLQVCSESDVHIGSLSNGEGGSVMCSPFLFPFVAKDPITGFPCVTRTRQMRNDVFRDQVGARHHHAVQQLA